MPFARPSPSALRSLLRRQQPLPRLASRRIAPNAQSRFYSSASDSAHGAGKSSDTPWIIGSIAFTVPAAWYLLSTSPPTKDTHHAHAEDKPEEEDSDDSDAGDKAEEVKDAAAEKVDEVKESAKETTEEVKDKASETSTDDLKEKAAETKESAKEKASDAAETVKDKVSGATESVKESGASAAETAKDKTSEAADSAKEATSGSPDDDKKTTEPPALKDEPSAAKEPRSANEMSGKQEGMSNSDTNHAVLHDERGEAISKKPEGAHDTAKVKGTVDPNRHEK